MARHDDGARRLHVRLDQRLLGDHRIDHRFDGHLVLRRLRLRPVFRPQFLPGRRGWSVPVIEAAQRFPDTIERCRELLRARRGRDDLARSRIHGQRRVDRPQPEGIRPGEQRRRIVAVPLGIPVVGWFWRWKVRNRNAPAVRRPRGHSAAAGHEHRLRRRPRTGRRGLVGTTSEVVDRCDPDGRQPLPNREEREARRVRRPAGESFKATHARHARPIHAIARSGRQIGDP